MKSYARPPRIPEAISGLTGFSGEAPIERITDHLGYAVTFLADDVFDSPIPLLSSTGTHPAFFGRMNNLLERLHADAIASKDEGAIRQLQMFRTIIAATNYLVAQKPVEIEFQYAFQYAYLDSENLYVVGNDAAPVVAIPLDSLVPGRQYRKDNQIPRHKATVRFAWAGRGDKTVTLRRDGTLRVIETSTGKSLSEKATLGKLGDNSCVRRFVVPPQPAAFLYVLSCKQGEPLVTRIDQSSNVLVTALREVVMKSGSCPLPGTDAVFDLNTSGQPIIVSECNGAYDLYTLTDDMQSLGSTRLSPFISLSAREIATNVKATPIPVIADASGRPYRFVTDLLSTTVALYDAANDHAAPFAVLWPGSTPSRLGPDLPASVTSSFYLTGDRRIVNLEGGGAYLVDFGTRKILPLRRKGLREMEQINSNTRGDWMYFQKYGNRILLFKGGVTND